MKVGGQRKLTVPAKVRLFLQKPQCKKIEIQEHKTKQNQKYNLVFICSSLISLDMGPVAVLLRSPLMLFFCLTSSSWLSNNSLEKITFFNKCNSDVPKNYNSYCVFAYLVFHIKMYWLFSLVFVFASQSPTLYLVFVLLSGIQFMRMHWLVGLSFGICPPIWYLELSHGLALGFWVFVVLSGIWAPIFNL